MSSLEDNIRDIMDGKVPSLPEKHITKTDKFKYLRENNSAIYDDLHDRQKAFAENIASFIQEHGKLEKTPKDGGAHYIENNPFAVKGIKCGNCLFYNSAGGCSVVSGEIKETAICKVWVVPSRVIK